MFAENCRAGSCCAAPPSSDVQAVAWWRHVIAGVVGAMALVAVATAAGAVCAKQYVLKARAVTSTTATCQMSIFVNGQADDVCA